jgi:Caspase domain
MSKLDEIRNRLKKDAESGSILDKYSDARKSTLAKPQSKDAGMSHFSFSDVEDDAPIVLQAHKRAIFIGNNEYDQSPLSKCVNDARSMQHVFSKIGYRLVYDFDINSEKMHKLFERFKSDIEEGDELLIYFSGHGAQVNSEIYLTPVDSPESMLSAFSTHFINLDKEMDEMLARGAKMVVAIVDACRNQTRIDYQSLGQAAYEQGMEDAIQMMQEEKHASKSTKNEFFSEISPELLKSKGKAILFASSHGTYSYDNWNGPELDNGVFTHFFLKEVIKPGRTITEVIERVRGLVSEYTDGQQVPAFHNNLPGDYYFINQS